MTRECRPPRPRSGDRTSDWHGVLDRDRDWPGIERLAARFEEPVWVFRGHRDASWRLVTTLDRVIRRWSPAPRSGPPIGRASPARPPPPRARDVEAAVAREFHRRAHLHAAPAGAGRGSMIELLALMQHHGAPTRLLDFTYSFWVALFFAFEHVDPGDKASPCVWAIDTVWLRDASLRRLRARGGGAAASAYEADLHGADPDTFDRVYRREPPIPFVLQQNCWTLHERLAAQQGVFLCPGDPDRCFEENLRAVAGERGARDHVLQIVLPRSLAAEVLGRLHRMNVTAATLYPGLDGFARSLQAMPARPGAIHPAGADTWRSLLDALCRRA